MAGMSLFASARERRLWLWTAAVVAAIYASLGRAPDLALSLPEGQLSFWSFVLGLLLVAGAVALQWLRRFPSWAELWVALGVVGVYLAALGRIQTPAERTHLFEYGLVVTLVHQALLERRNQGRRVPAPAVLAFGITALLGWLDEGIQALLPNRFYDLVDVGFNLFAAFMAILASLALAWARDRWGKRPN